MTRYVVLEALLANGQIDHKLIHEEIFTDEGSDPSAFFVPGISSDHRKVGVVEMSIAEDLSGRLDYSGALPDMWTESHE